MKQTITARISINAGPTVIGHKIDFQVKKECVPDVITSEFYEKIYRDYKSTGHWSWGVPTFASVRFLNKTVQVV